MENLTVSKLKEIAAFKNWQVCEEYEDQIAIQMTDWVWTWFNIYSSFDSNPDYLRPSHKYSQRTGNRKGGVRVRLNIERSIQNAIDKMVIKKAELPKLPPNKSYYISQPYGGGFLYHSILWFTGEISGDYVKVVTSDHTTDVQKNQIVIR